MPSNAAYVGSSLGFKTEMNKPLLEGSWIERESRGLICVIMGPVLQLNWPGRSLEPVGLAQGGLATDPSGDGTESGTSRNTSPGLEHSTHNPPPSSSLIPALPSHTRQGILLCVCVLACRCECFYVCVHCYFFYLPVFEERVTCFLWDLDLDLPEFYGSFLGQW